MRYQKRLAAACFLVQFSAQALILQLPCYAETAFASSRVESGSVVPIAASAVSKETPVLKDCRKVAQTVASEDTKDAAAIVKLKQPGAKRPKIGLALGGGGIRGAAHIGVLRVLEKEGIPVDCVAGTSIGAIVGGLYCAGLSLDDIEKMIAKQSLKRAYYTVPLWFRMALVPVFFVPHVLRPHYDGLYRGNKFAHFLNKHVGEKEQNIEDLKIPFCAIASSLLDREAHAIKKGNFGRALQASSAIPVLRRPVELNSDLYIDGGIVNNLPVDECRAMGADIVIAVSLNIDDEATNSKDFEQFKKIGSIGNRVINMILCRTDKDQLRRADILIKPSLNEIRFLSTKEKDAYAAIAAGESAAQAAIEKVRQEILAHSSATDGQDETRTTE